MTKSSSRYVPALGRRFLTGLYDPAVALTTRERRFKGLLVEQADVPDRGDVLDLGCGTGTLAIAMARRYPAARIVGVDGDPEVLAIAERKAGAAGACPRFHRGLSQALPYADASFDRVVSSLFFHHLAPGDKRRTISEVHRVLRPGGWLHVADWGRPANALMRLLFLPVRLLDGFETTRDSVRGALPGLFEAAGFERVAVRHELQTMLGTLALYAAVRAASGTGPAVEPVSR